MFSVCILFVRENGFVYVTLKWFIGNIEREIKERFVTLKKKVEASIGRKREKKKWTPPVNSLVGPTCEQSCGAHHEQYMCPLRTVCGPHFEQYCGPILQYLRPTSGPQTVAPPLRARQFLAL